MVSADLNSSRVKERGWPWALNYINSQPDFRTIKDGLDLENYFAFDSSVMT